MKNSKLSIITNALKAFILPVACYLIFLVLSGGTFGTPATLINNAVKSVSPILLAYGVLLLLVEGNMDMSIGASVYLTAIIGGNLGQKLGWGIGGIIIICIIVSIICCLIKATVNYFLNISYNLLSIGFLLVFECCTYFLFDSKGAIVMGDITRIARAPYCFIFIAAALAGIYVIWKKSLVASHIRTIGSNRIRAELSGIDIKKTEFKAIMMGSVFMGFSSVFFLTNSGLVQPVLNMASMSLCFDAMIAVFIGMSLQRYISMPIAIIIGVFTIKMLGTGILSLGIPSYMQNVFTGVFLIIFMGISINQNKIFEIRENKKRAKQIKEKYGF